MIHKKANPPLKTRGRTINFGAGIYDAVNTILSFGHLSSMTAEAVSCLNINPDDKILDAGCGTGLMTFEIAGQLRKPGIIIGIDAAENMIRVANHKLAQTNLQSVCSFQAAVAEKLPFNDHYFDCYFSSMFFHHLPIDLKISAMKEAYRVLRPGGTMITVDIDKPDTFCAKFVATVGYLILVQKAIKENLDGVLSNIMSQTGFTQVTQVKKKLGLISMFRAVKPISAQ